MSNAVLRVAAVALVTLVVAPPAVAAPVLEAPGAQAEPAAQALAQEAPAENNIVDFGFEPSDLTVNVGDSVTWTNQGAQPHTVTDRGGTFDTDPLTPGASGTVTFQVPGTYFFFCRINPGSMNGVVVVQDEAGAAPATRVQAVDDAREGEELRFDPADLTVEAGTEIQFANVGGKPHTMTADDGSFDTGEVAPGAEEGRFAGTAVSFQAPSEPGEIAFRCLVHPEAMQGVLTVVDPAGEPPPGEGGEEPPAEPAPEAAGVPDTVEVGMADFSFDPIEVTVAPGGTITWTNNGEAPHTATFDEEELDTGNVESGAQGTLTAPTEPGSYTYRCDLHPGQMQAVLTVANELPAEAGVQAAPDAAPAADTGDDEGSRGLSLFVLITAVLGAFAAGTGLTAFLRSRSRAANGS